MTKLTQQEIEIRFNKLKDTLSGAQWTDADYLYTKVEELESSDLPLAFRLMQRVRNLAPNEANLKNLSRLKALVLKESPELTKVSSRDLKTRLQGNATTLRSQINGVLNHPKLKQFQKPFTLFVLLPFLLFSFYQLVLASPRYESQAKLIVKEPDGMATLGPAMALMSGFGVSASNLDTELVKAFIYSNDMLSYLENTLQISMHFSDKSYDFFSRLESDASKEEILEFYSKHVLVELDENSQVISIFVQAFEPQFARLITQTIVQRAEWFINEIGHNLAKEQMEFVKNEHQLVEERLQKAKTELLAFQRRHDLLDPQAEGMALQQIAYQLEGQIAAKRTELIALRNSMSEEAPQVVQAKSQLDSMQRQLEKERSRLSSSRAKTNLPAEEQNLSVSEVLSRFSDYKINMELALQAYTSSQVSLEKARIEAYRQLKYLVTVESPTQPQEAKYPEKLYNISLFFVVLLLLFGIGRIIFATVSELR